MNGKRFIFVFIGLLFVVACSNKEIASSHSAEDEMSYIVKFKAGISDSSQQQVLRNLELKAKNRLDLVGAVVCVYDGKLPAKELIEKGKSFPEIEYIEPDYTVHTQ